ncbi:MAG TPA: prepilin peptidase [Deinococcales bacterium]|nr:prepilin peptidase [Deinococcales bacterium]
MEWSLLVMSFALGAVLGSFGNVVSYRLPRGESLVSPPSHCPNCGHRLGALDLVPVLSWVFLRRRCRYCRAPISARYPIGELLMGLVFLAIEARFPLLDFGWGTVGMWVLAFVLLVASSVDINERTIPDSLTLPAVAVGLVVAFANGDGALGLPNPPQALQGALLGAGLLVLVGGYGSWVLRRFAEPRFPDFPIGFPQVFLGALVGAWLGPVWGTAVGGASTLVNLARGKVLRVPDWLTLGGLLASVVLLSFSFGPGIISGVQGATQAAGALALLAGVYWAFTPEDEDADREASDPVAMGFGDVKLAAVIGAFLGWPGLIVTLAVAILLGAVLGVIGRLFGAGRELPFGPYLALGAMVAMLVGTAPLDAYLRAVGL